MKILGQMTGVLQGIFLLVLALFSISPGSAEDWTHYRGPRHDGISRETIRTNWAAESPKLIWKTNLAAGLSSFTISNGRAFTQVRRGSGYGREHCVALDANTGRELWGRELGLADYPNGGVGSDDGPRSTPCVDGDRVYVFTTYLRLACLNAGTGEIIWSRDFMAELGSSVVEWQNAASPVISGDLIFVNCNASGQRLMAVNKNTGATVWKGQNDIMTQATPVLAEVAGIPQVIFFARSGLVSVAPDDGRVLWRYPFRFSVSTAASPVVANDTIYCSAAYGVGAGLTRITRNGENLASAQVWATRGDNMNHWATPVYHEGFFYGVYGESLMSLRCVDAATGARKWTQPGVGQGGILMVAGLLLVSTEDGELVLARPNPEAYTEAARFQAVQGKCWNVPAISNGRIYFRSTLQGAAYDVADLSAPKPKLALGSSFNRNDGFQLTIRAEDGSSLSQDRAAKIDVFSSTVLGVNLSQWEKVAIPLLATNGQFNLTDPRSLSEPRRFYRTEERP